MDKVVSFFTICLRPATAACFTPQFTSVASPTTRLESKTRPASAEWCLYPALAERNEYQRKGDSKGQRERPHCRDDSQEKEALFIVARATIYYTRLGVLCAHDRARF